MSTVSLVLGSGGARGLAHIGVIDWLVEHGHEIRAIAGSSMGALVGGIHATHRLHVYADWVSALERGHVLRLLDPTLGREGLFKGERIMGVLRELIGDCAIGDLPLAYTAVATDMDSGDEVWLREGNLFDAIRASIATPMVFTPFRHGGRTLLDGAIVNPLPVNALHGPATDLTIAVNLSGPPMADATGAGQPEPAAPRRPLRALVNRLPLAGRRHAPPPPAQTECSRGLLDVAFVSMQAMQDTITRLKLAQCAPDVVIEIPRDACGFHEFWRAREMIALGRAQAERTLGATPGATRGLPESRSER